MAVVWLVAGLVLAYLMGSLSGSLIIGPLIGRADPRASGSHNAGATNALRTGGLAYGAAVLIFDCGKGALAAGVLPLIAGGGPAFALACGAAAVLGHLYPVFFGFRGGKGFATVIGVLLVVLPYTLIVGALAFIATLVASGYVGLATVVAMWALTALCLVLPNYGLAAALFTIAASALITYTHRGNLRRVRAGTENQFTRVMWRRRR